MLMPPFIMYELETIRNKGTIETALSTFTDFQGKATFEGSLPNSKTLHPAPGALLLR
jgi:hypothetical protein